jgi:Flp pilus assembly protein TadD
LCVVYLELGQNKDAVGCYKELFPIASDDVSVRSNYGFALINLKQPKEAIKILEETIRLFPRHTEALINFGIALFQVGRLKEAISAFNNALQIEPENQTARFNLAMTQLANNNKSAALEQYAFLKNSNAELARQLFKIIYRDKIVAAKEK